MTNKSLTPAILLSLFLLETSFPASAKSVGDCWGVDKVISENCSIGDDDCGTLRRYPADEGTEELSDVLFSPYKNKTCFSGNYIQLDCYGKGMDDEHTGNTITATIHMSDGEEIDRWSGKVGCDSITDHTYHFILNGLDSDDNIDVGDPRAKGMYVVLSTNGTDGFWIDEMYLGLSEYGADPVIAHWGQENGMGFCLSRDPNDANGDWKGKVEGCHKAIKFVVSGCKYPKKKGDKCEDEAFKDDPMFVLDNPYGLKGYTEGSGTAWLNVNSVHDCAAKAAEKKQTYFTWYSKGEYPGGALCKTWNDPAIRWQKSTRDVEMIHYATTRAARELFKNAQ